MRFQQFQHENPVARDERARDGDECGADALPEREHDRSRPASDRDRSDEQGASQHIHCELAVEQDQEPCPGHDQHAADDAVTSFVRASADRDAAAPVITTAASATIAGAIG